MPRYWHERYPGKHVAIDMRIDEVVLVADSPRESQRRSGPRTMPLGH